MSARGEPRTAKETGPHKSAWRTPEPQRRYDAVIVGGGLNALAAAYEVAFRHRLRNIAVIVEGYVGCDAGAAIPSLPISAPRDLRAVRLQADARTHFAGLPSASGASDTPPCREVVEIAVSPSGRRALTMRAGLHRLSGIDVRPLGLDELGRDIPLLKATSDACAAVAFPKAALLRRDRALRAYASAASALGVDIVEQCRTTGFSREGGRITHIETARGSIETSRIAIAAPRDSSRIAGLAGLSLPLAREVRRVWKTEALEPVLSKIVAFPEEGLAIGQSEDGTIAIQAISDEPPPVGDLQAWERALRRIYDLFPSLGMVEIVEHGAERYERSLDGLPLMVSTPDEIVLACCGFDAISIESAAFGAALLADKLANRETSNWAESLGLARFSATPARAES